MPKQIDVPRQSYARGVGEKLQKMGEINIPSPQLLKQAAAEAVKHIKSSPQNGVTPEETVKVAGHFIEVNENLRQRGKTASRGSAPSISQSEYGALGDLIVKVSQEAKKPSNKDDESTRTVKNDDNPARDNTERQSAKHDPLAEMDLEERPEGYANKGQGGTNIDGEVPAGATEGSEQNHPKKPKDTSDMAENSVERASQNSSKTSSFADRLLKMSMDGKQKNENNKSERTVKNDNNPARDNTEQNSTKHDPLAQMDMEERPKNYANKGQGNTNIDGVVPSDAREGMEKDHPKQPKDSPKSPQNSAERTTKSAEWKEHFRKTASEVVPRLPNNMNQDEKVAAVRECMSLPPASRDQYIRKVAAQKRQESQQVQNFLGNLGL